MQAAVALESRISCSTRIAPIGAASGKRSVGATCFSVDFMNPSFNDNAAPWKTRYFLGAGVLIFFAGLAMLAFNVLVFVLGENVEGVVVGESIERRTDLKDVHHAILEFTVPSTQKKIRQQLQLVGQDHAIGNRVSLKYWQTTGSIRTRAFFDTWALPTIVSLFGIVFISVYRLIRWLLSTQLTLDQDRAANTDQPQRPPSADQPAADG